MSRWSDRKMGIIPPNHVVRIPHRVIAFYAGHVKSPESGNGRFGDYSYRCHAAHCWRRTGDQWELVSSSECSDLIAFWSWLKSQLSKTVSTWVLTYNVAWSATLVDFWENLADSTWTIGPCVLEDSPVIVRVRRPEGRLRLLDLRNYFTSPLPDLMRSVGQIDGNQPGERSGLPEWLHWCECRSRAIGDLFLRHVRLWQSDAGGNFGSTAGSCAWANYRHSFMATPIELHQSPECLALERASYHGGFSDCFFVGQAESVITKLDVNSGYPWAMGSRPYPCRLIRYDADMDVGRCKLRGPPSNAIADVLVETTEQTVPVMFQGRLLEALGTFRVALAGDELVQAAESGLIRRWYQVAEYDVADLFSEYVLHWYGRKVAARESGDLAGYEIAKIMLCSLYGKFAAWNHPWLAAEKTGPSEPFARWTAIDALTQECCEFRHVAWRTERQAAKTEWQYSFPAIASMITSRLRVRMKYLRSVAGSRHVLAQSTDSLYVTDDGFRNLQGAGEIDQTKIGALKSERISDGMDIRGVGCWWHGGQQVACGLKLTAAPLPNGDYLQETNQGLQTILNQPTRDRIRVRETRWSPVATYDKGYLSSSGWTAPYVIAGDRIQGETA